MSTTQELRDLKKMSGTGNFYRIRVGDYRLGAVVEGDQVEFVRCLPRRDLYRFFP
jgi:mRNA interferase RelE/StbE